MPDDVSINKQIKGGYDMKKAVLRDWHTNEILAILIFKKEVEEQEICDIIGEVQNEFPDDWTVGDIEERLVEQLEVEKVIYLENEENIYI